MTGRRLASDGVLGNRVYRIALALGLFSAFHPVVQAQTTLHAWADR